MLVDHDGRLAMVGRDEDVPTPAGARAVSFPDAILIPGLVNTHTHLELTHLGGPITRPSFVEWIQHVRRAKEATTAARFLDSARTGIRDAWRHGTTTVADTGDSTAVASALSELGGRGIVFQEVFAPDPSQADSAMESLRDVVGRLLEAAPPSVRIGVSPHAPYTVSEHLYRRVAEFAAAEHLPVAVHIAESKAESALVADGDGPFAAALAGRGIPSPPRAVSPVRYLDGLGLLDVRPLAIHVVQADADDVSALADHGCPVAACPESNRAHDHGAPPLATMLEAGVRVGLGTDSVASVGQLDMFREMRAAKALAPLTSEAALRLATLDAAAALGMDREIGSLTPGKWADLCVLRAPSPGLHASGADAVVAAGPGDVLQTFVGGRCVFDASPAATAAGGAADQSVNDGVP